MANKSLRYTPEFKRQGIVRSWPLPQWPRSLHLPQGRARTSTHSTR